MLYDAVNEAVLSRIPTTARRVLDLGCGCGALGRRLKQRQEAEIVGVTFSREEASRAKGVLDGVVEANLEDLDVGQLGRFDCVVASHVLEHLQSPEALLERVRSCLDESGVLLVALPNALYYRQRLAFLGGHFRYTDGGLMDRTHLRFYDWSTARQLVTRAGFRLVGAFGEGGLPGSRFLGPARKPVDQLTSRALPGLFAVQFVLVATLP